MAQSSLGANLAVLRKLEDHAALLHGPEQIADLPVPVAESPGAVRIGHPERSHLVEYLAPNSVFNSLPRQRSSPHLLCLLFIHPGAPNLISLRSAGTMPA